MPLSASRQSRRLSATLRPLPSLTTGLPRLLASSFRRAVPTTPADRAGAHVDCFPAHTAFPKWQEGRHPHCHFRGLLRLHTRYGPPDRSAALKRPLPRASNPSISPHEPLVSYRINRQLSGWNPPPLMMRAFGAHCHIRTFAPTMFSRCSGSDTRINEPGKRAEPVLKIPSAFRSPLAQTARVWGIVAAVSLVDIGTLDLAAGEPLSGFDYGAQRVAVIRIAGQRPGVQNKLATRCPSIGGDDGSFHTEFVRRAGLASADALH